MCIRDRIYIAVQKTESTGSTLEAATATLSRAEAAETGWYCALAAGIEEEDFEDMAEWIEAREKIFGYSYKDPNSNPVTKIYYRTFGICYGCLLYTSGRRFPLRSDQPRR